MFSNRTKEKLEMSDVVVHDRIAEDVNQKGGKSTRGIYRISRENPGTPRKQSQHGSI